METQNTPTVDKASQHQTNTSMVSWNASNSVEALLNSFTNNHSAMMLDNMQMKSFSVKLLQLTCIARYIQHIYNARINLINPSDKNKPNSREITIEKSIDSTCGNSLKATFFSTKHPLNSHSVH